MNRIFVTGAAGFVGQALCRRLLVEGWHVRAAVRDARKMPLPQDTDVLRIGNIEQVEDWVRPLSGMRIVVHLAARVHVQRDTAPDPLATYREVNVRATQRLARAAAAAGVQRLIYLSTVKVHGEISKKPVTEKDPIAPADPYSLSKWEAEQVLRQTADETGLDVVILRPPLVYGPGVKANFLNLMQWVATGLPLPVGAINNRRSLIFLHNLIDAISLVIARPEAAGQTFLVSDGQDVSTPQLIRQIAAAMHLKPRLLPLSVNVLKFLAGLSGRRNELAKMVESLYVDPSKITGSLGWQPPYAFEQGILETVQWYRAT